MDKITSRPIQCFKKGDAFVEMAPRPLVFMEVNEVKVPQNYTNENGGKNGGKVGGENVPSLSQALSLVCSQLSEVQLKKIVSVIDYLFRASGSITELMDYAGEKNKNRFRQTILKPLVDTGLVEPTIKDVPNSPKQKYALTDEGKEKFKAIS